MGYARAADCRGYPVRDATFQIILILHNFLAGFSCRFETISPVCSPAHNAEHQYSSPAFTSRVP